ncbi:MAG: BolA family transcriptional regulator [Micavibrio sp.]|nr:BolA family transcriptional regulator [Micavibrio sp.]
MSVEQEIRRKIVQEFSPSRLEIINESSKHKGHAGDNGTGESHFKLIIASKTFYGKSKIECHTLIYSCLKELMDSKIHALSITTTTE